ncbi:MAG: hypothetical protein AMS22_04120 [Thiotrichales bacterium SG8_50]|nr:MAG: hypothetical protein AMS22_04120 [Thiotrichales bacterium SG8_50]
MPHRLCPWWLGYFHLGPLRGLRQDPQAILSPYVGTGMTVLDAGCGMGYFSLPLARMVGPTGRVICVDVQRRMIDALSCRARRAGLDERIEARVCQPTDLGIQDLRAKINFALLFAVAHEVADQAGFFQQVYASLSTGARVLLAEPVAHVRALEFARSLDVAATAGLTVLDQLDIGHARAAVLVAVPTDPAGR